MATKELFTVEYVKGITDGRVNRKVDQIIQRAESLQRSLATVVRDLKENREATDGRRADYCVNTLGVLQGNGVELDRWLGELGALCEAQELLAEMAKEAQG